MSDTPDISKIISLIMENPDLVKQIASLMNNSQTAEQTEAKETEQVSLPADVPVVMREATPRHRKPERTQLLTAMKPYVRESRSKAIDTMVGILDIIDVIGGK